MKLILTAIGILLFCISGMAIRIWGKKGGKLAGTCVSQNPHLNPEGEACSFCGRMPDEQGCHNKQFVFQPMSSLLAERIAEAKNGKQQAFSWLLDEFWIDVYNFQLKCVGSEAEAEDVTVRTFAHAFNEISSFDKQYSFRAWLITISKNIHIDLLRRQNEPILHLDTEEKESKRIADESPTIEDSLIMEQQFDYLLKYIKQLGNPYQTAIQLHYLQEKSYKEIVEEMSSTMSNMRIILLRVKKILAEILRRNR